ncbi:hypothetical protein PHLGIDRAFT_104012 [Phlebiopsis gigantea 11061_1 CR5-6]|uniref:YCII-related domain-containing protein n=1 Tax=Phlebiopsis gigantea (strain 11061_1 CR5-6) TaxID=745531 RepID=A0A0C3SCA5_PHLG1|nr:hypothetical protein PHLGIDRAFT_104012 [Phlebiopsis gigantea 11061_1 CR5-6]
MSQARQTYTYLAFMPDYTDEDAFERRLAVRPKHLENSKLVRERGLLKLGGPLISPETYRSEQKKLIGSAGLYEAESIEEIRKVIEEDIYYTSGVWDKEKIVILPWSAALPIPIVQD